MKLKTLAIPIRRVDYSDSSQIVALFTREQGRIDCIAKGAYRERNNNFQGPFDLMTLSEVLIVPRRGSQLSILAEATQFEGFRGTRRSWQSHTAASHILEFLRFLEIASDTSVPLFDLTVEALHILSFLGFEEDTDLTARAIGDLLAAFELRAFRLLGMSSEIESCAECGRPWRHAERPVFFSLEDDSVLCARCRQKRRRVHGRTYPGEVVRVLNTLVLPTSAPDAFADPLDPDALETHRRSRLPATAPELHAELHGLLGQLREFLLERRFSMVEYLDGFI